MIKAYKPTKQHIINRIIRLIQCMYSDDSGAIQKVIKGLNKMAYHEVNNLLFFIELKINDIKPR